MMLLLLKLMHLLPGVVDLAVDEEVGEVEAEVAVEAAVVAEAEPVLEVEAGVVDEVLQLSAVTTLPMLLLPLWERDVVYFEEAEEAVVVVELGWTLLSTFVLSTIASTS